MTQEPIEKFWMVWCTTRGGPVYRHASKEAARKEACRLASSSPGSLFVILSAVDAVICPVLDPQPVKLVKPKAAAGSIDDDIPFF